jgi:hypothetical protein
MIRKPMEAKLLDKTQILEGKGEIFIATQSSQNEIVLIDIKKACIKGKIDKRVIKVGHPH